MSFAKWVKLIYEVMTDIFNEGLPKWLMAHMTEMVSIAVAVTIGPPGTDQCWARDSMMYMVSDGSTDGSTDGWFWFGLLID